MSGKVFSATFSLIAIIDGEDAVSLDASPAAIVWNQEGDVTTDADGKTTDNSKWPEQYVSASVLRGDNADSGWTFGYSIGAGCSLTVKIGKLSATGVFTEDKTGSVFQLGSPVRTKDANGKDVSDLWTNGVLTISATKDGKTLTKDIPIALNALATWKMSVINGTMTAVSKQTEQTLENGYVKKTDYESDIKQTKNEISTKVSQTELSNVAAGEGSSVDIDLVGKDEDTFYLVLFDYINNNPDLFVFGVKKKLFDEYDTRTSYGTWKSTDGKGGFETYLQWQEHFAGWGARDIDRVVDCYTKRLFINDNTTYAVGSIGQYEQNGPVYVYLRGGARYHLYCDHLNMNIHLATQADLDRMKNTDDVPALTLALADVIEPVPQTTEIYSTINQTAKEINLSVTNVTKGLINTGINITDGTITATGDKFTWNDTNGNSVLYMDSNGANFSGNVSAKTLTTTSGKSKIDEDGILTAVGANIKGYVTAGSDDGKAVELNAEQGSMVIYGEQHDYRTEHTGKTFASLDDVLPGASFTPTYSTSGFKVITDYIRKGGSSKVITMATMTPTATGTISITVSSLLLYTNTKSGSLEATAELLWNGNVIHRLQLLPSSVQQNGEKNLNLQVFANKGVACKLELRVTITSYMLSELEQAACATAEAQLSSMTFSATAYRSMFFGNGLALSQGSSNSFVAMIDSSGKAIVQGRSGNYGVRLSANGIQYMLDGNTWLPLNDGIVDVSGNYTVAAGIGTVICMNSSAVTISMAGSPYKGQKITVIQANSNLTFLGNGHSFRWRNNVMSSIASSHIGQKTEFYFDGTYWQVFQVNSEQPY